MESKQRNSPFSQRSFLSVLLWWWAGLAWWAHSVPPLAHWDWRWTTRHSFLPRTGLRRVERKTRVGLFRGQERWKVTPLQGGMQGRGKFLSHWEHAPWWIFREERVPANTVNFRWIYDTESDSAHSKAGVCMQAKGIILTPQKHFCELAVLHFILSLGKIYNVHVGFQKSK